jgi:diacylglycerol kinase (ATP)
MRISLLYHEDAGDGISIATVRHTIEQHGHEVAHVVTDADEFKRSFADGIDLAVAAGGDGTARRAALALAGASIPLAILPFGTANNIARSLGLAGTLDAHVARWMHADRKRIDLGIVEGPWGSCPFVESAGAGLLVEGMDAAHQRTADGTEADTRLTIAIDAFLAALQRLAPQPSTIVVDGHRMVGSFLMIELLNIGSVGPQLDLAPNADPTDGWLTIVTAEDEHRADLIAYLSARAAGSAAELPLPSRRARHIELSGWNAIHLDDRILSEIEGRIITVSLGPSSVVLLL